MTHIEVIKNIYESALVNASEESGFPIEFGDELISAIDAIVVRSESSKAVLTVLITLLTHKIVDPQQDIRLHQAKMKNGFSGRSIDTAVITPFMKSVNFPSMASSGWLTRSLEQPFPYTLDYKGDIASVKAEFLHILDQVQVHNASAEQLLLYIFTKLIKKRDSMIVELAKPHSLAISDIIALLESHFTARYNSSGASRLPALAVYAAYQCMKSQVLRYEDKVLCPLESHNSADSQSGRISDVDINNSDGGAFEGVEIKHGIVITRHHIADAYEKFKIYKTDRYYILTTGSMDNADWKEIDAEIRRVADIHGCQVIVNGVYDTLKYYLRLLKDPAEFIEKYVEAIKIDKTIKFQHKTMWNDIISGKLWVKKR
jgi:DNA (cytosine-5)-methyltransferase 1